MTTLVGVLGYPVGHSRSPAMHNAAFRELGLDWRYEALEVAPERFEAELRALPGRGYAGANVTVPHKLSALALADTASRVAREVGAANTLAFAGDEIAADNTDVDGFLRALREQAPGYPAGVRALVLGAGGAARAVVYALVNEGAASIDVWNRHPERARELVAELGQRALGVPLAPVAEPADSSPELLVNATSVGMGPPAPGGLAAGPGGRVATGPDDFKVLHISADKFADVQVAVDLVYRDGGTLLGREAKARGLIFVDGIDILAHQGAASFELWTGNPAPLEVMRLAARTRHHHEPG